MKIKVRDLRTLPLMTMPGIIATLGIPVVIVFSIPLAIFAVITTTLAFWVLLFRVLVVYAELLTALLQAYVSPETPQQRNNTDHSSVQKPRSPKSRRTSRSSSTSSGLVMRAPQQNQSSTVLPEQVQPRDYEGVGGWRLQEDSDEEALWLNMNSRLDLSSEYSKRHNRSYTSLSRPHSGYVSPELVRSPPALRPPSRHRRQGSGPGSPVGYFAIASSERASRVSFENMSNGVGDSTGSLPGVRTVKYDPA